MEDVFKNRIDLSRLHDRVQQIKAEIGKVIVGQEAMVELMITAIFARGHVLIEGVPGVAKTLAAKLLAKTIDARFSRIQFTPDLMPSDVLGTSVFNPRNTEFEFRPGPVFANVVLIDEINRSPAKTQAALFEVMEERQISIDGKTYNMGEPFLVLATQNPIEQEGTYRLPEAQLDRFLFKIAVGYPTLEEEIRILAENGQQDQREQLARVGSVLTAQEIQECRELIRQIHVEEKLLGYVARIAQETRANASLYLGASPRASVALLNSSRALAGIRGRDFVTPEDVKMLAVPVLRHRVMLTPDKEMEGLQVDEVIRQIVNKVEVPR
ncbi:MAG: AAA family ATPase [Cyclobacteriaceae bacterium]|jgi:MoxR-like ATPase|nr:MoxR family ATPase [Flammeovirgaceae bacterium]